MDFKGTREFLGLSQAEIGRLIGKPQSTISSVENGFLLPDLDEMVILQNELNNKISWHESIAHPEKIEILQALNSLAQDFPLAAVLKFGLKVLGERNPGRKLAFYAGAARRDEGSLLPPGVE